MERKQLMLWCWYLRFDVMCRYPYTLKSVTMYDAVDKSDDVGSGISRMG